MPEEEGVFRMGSETWTLGRLLDWTTQYLKEKQAETPRLDAEVLLANTVGCSRIQLYTRFDEPASEAIRGKYRELVKKRIEGCPVAYLVGYKEFYSLRFAVTPSVLIPRPETEILVMEAIRLARPMTAPQILDIGTGSGAIAIALAKHLPQAQITATDLSEEALTVARQNAQTLGLAERIRFLQGNLFEPVSPSDHFDLIVSNPPYVASEEWNSLPVSVAKFEPRLALHGGLAGLEVITKLLPEARMKLSPNGYLLLEIGAGQANQVSDLLTAKEGWRGASVIPDHASLPRVVRAQAATSS
jgi:release factor glutamine methyltransferase